MEKWINEVVEKVVQELKKDLNRDPEYPRWMNVGQLAAYLGISERKIRALIAEETVPFSKIDGIIRFNRHKIDLWVEFNGRRKQFSKKDLNKLKIIGDYNNV